MPKSKRNRAGLPSSPPFYLMIYGETGVERHISGLFRLLIANLLCDFVVSLTKTKKKRERTQRIDSNIDKGSGGKL